MSILSEYHNATVRAMHADDGMLPFDEQAALDYDHASDLSVHILATAGLRPGDEDCLNTDISEDVQTLLTLALARNGRLREFLEELVEKA